MPDSEGAPSNSALPQIEESDGLHITWEASKDDTDLVAFDYVVVPGVYGQWNDQSRSGPGSGTSSWVSQYAENLEYTACSRILRFEYPSRRLFSGRKSRKAIRDCAINLLRGLTALRRNETRKRLIMFIAHDLGGIIVKDALVAAALDQTSWPSIVNLSRALVFMGCPHRSIGVPDMEDRLALFLFADYEPGVAEVRPAMSSIAGLAAAVIEINGLFIEYKITLRSRLTSIYKGPERAKSNINPVFDSYCATLGLPLERRIEEDLNEEEYPCLKDHLRKVAFVLKAKYDHDIVDFEGTLLSLAPPLPSLRGKKTPNAFVTQTPEYRAWLESQGPQVLYIHGSSDVRDATEQIFFALDDQANLPPIPRTAVLYFSFDKWDIRRNSMRDMVSTFLTQLICQYPRLTTTVQVKSMIERISKEPCWTEADMLYWFQLVWSNTQVKPICVINYFDECVEGPRAEFLKGFLRFAQSSELSRKLVITSRLPGSLLSQLSDYPYISLDLTTHEVQDTATLTHLPPEVLSREDQVRKQWQDVAAIDPLLGRILLAQETTRESWSYSISLADLCGPSELPVLAEGINDHFLSLALDRLLKTIPEPATLHQILSWLLYSVRPLTISELTAALDTDTELAVPSLEKVESMRRKIQTWLVGIVEIDHSEIKVVHPRLRDIMTPQGDPVTPYIWDRIRETAHYDIANCCLDYLCRPQVQDMIAKTYHVPRSTETHFSADRGNLCSYALRGWTYHFSRITPGPNRTKLSEKFASKNVARSLAVGHWALSNCITRTSRPPETLFPVFAGLGLLDVARPVDQDDALGGLIEAASKGQGGALNEILGRVKFSEPGLLEALVAAGTSADEQILLGLVDHILSKSAKPDSIPWPTNLLHRAAWLGFDRFLDKMLSLGCPVDANPPWHVAETTLLSQAVRNSHDRAVRVLLKHGANIAHRSNWERTVLHLAASDRSSETVKSLVEARNVELEAKDENGYTPLYFACLFGNYRSAEVLLRGGADSNMGSSPGRWSPLVAAADDGFQRCVLLLLEKGADPNISGGAGTPLLYAAVKGHTEVCRMLLDAGADPKHPADDPPILIQVIRAASQDIMFLDVLTLLVERGADVNARDSKAKSALMCAAIDNQGPNFVPVLLSHGANMDLRDQEGQSVVYYAVEGQLATLEFLLEHGADPNCLSNLQHTPVYNAVSKPDFLRVLLEKGADPNLGRFGGYTSLMYAARNGRETSLELLLKYKATVDLTYSSGSDASMAGWTALGCAVTWGSAGTVRLLAEYGADLQCKLAVGATIVSLAADGDTLDALLEFPTRIDIDATNGDGWAALHYISIDMPNFKRLVNAGADVNITTNDQDTPIALAANAGQIEKVTYLLKHGADIRLGHRAYGPALTQACRTSRFDIVKLLVEHKADVNQPSEGNGGTPLSATCAMQADMYPGHCKDIIHYLLENGVNVNGQGGWYGYPIIVAARNMPPNIVRILLDKGAKVNARDTMGRTPIHLAAFHGADNLQTILDAGGDIKAVDATGRTALHWAAAVGRTKAVERILSLASDEPVDARDIDGWTPLCWAARGPLCDLEKMFEGEPSDQLKVIQRLLEHGADRSVVVSVGDQKWTVLKIARFSGAEDDVLQILEKGIDATDNSDDPPTSKEYETKKANMRRSYCDFCHCKIRGFGYNCNSCFDFDFCFKCYSHRALFHAAGHEFTQLGPEFEVEDQGEKDDASSDTTTSTDSGSDKTDQSDNEE